MKQFRIFIIIVFSSLYSIGQEVDLLKELKELNIHYAQMEKFEIDIYMQYLNSKNEPIITQSGNVIYGDKVHYIEMGGNKTLLKNNNYVSVNEDYNILVFREFEEIEEVEKIKKNEVNFAQMIDSLWLNQEELDYTIIQSKAGTLRVLITDESLSEMESYEITINIEHNRLLEIAYYYKAVDSKSAINQVRIQYKNETNRPKLNQDKLKIDFYVSMKNGELTLTDNFKNYQLIDQTQSLKDYE